MTEIDLNNYTLINGIQYYPNPYSPYALYMSKGSLRESASVYNSHLNDKKEE